MIRKATAVTFCKRLQRSRAAEAAAVGVAFFGFYFFGWGRRVPVSGLGAAAGGLVGSGDGWGRS